MIIRNLVIMIFISLGIFSCGKMSNEDAGEINFRIKLVYGDQPLEMFKNYEYPVTKDKLLMTRLSFYISDMTLRAQNGDIIVKDIDYLNLTNSHTAPVAPNGFEYKISEVRPGNYTSFDFGIGVPKDSNAKAPKDFKSVDILSSSAEYWSAWKSYIFFRPEGQISLNGKLISETSFALHLGANDAYKKIVLNKTLTIVKDQVTHVDIILDMQKFFNGKTLYDIRTTQQIHSLSQMPIISQLAENLSTAFR